MSRISAIGLVLLGLIGVTIKSIYAEAHGSFCVRLTTTGFHPDGHKQNSATEVSLDGHCSRFVQTGDILNDDHDNVGVSCIPPGRGIAPPDTSS